MMLREWVGKFLGRVRRTLGPQGEETMQMHRICIDVSQPNYELLQVLGRGDGWEVPPRVVVEALIDQALQGAYRPDVWQRGWVISGLGDEWLLHLQPGDPYGRTQAEDPRVTSFQRPRRDEPRRVDEEGAR